MSGRDDIIRAATDRSPLFTGAIEGGAGATALSVEVTRSSRFADKSSARFLPSPRASDNHEVYPNGISTSLPLTCNTNSVRSIRGFEQAHLTRPGHAIEYDFFDPRDLVGVAGNARHPRAALRRPDQMAPPADEGGRRPGPGRLAGINAVQKASQLWSPGCRHAAIFYLGKLVA